MNPEQDPDSRQRRRERQKEAGQLFGKNNYDDVRVPVLRFAYFFCFLPNFGANENGLTVLSDYW